jgi:hypothetical protein
MKTALHHYAIDLKTISLLTIWHNAFFKQRKVLSARSESLEAVLLKKQMFLNVILLLAKYFQTFQKDRISFIFITKQFLTYFTVLFAN